jgi:Aldehyde dehydrogenase family
MLSTFPAGECWRSLRPRFSPGCRRSRSRPPQRPTSPKPSRGSLKSGILPPGQPATDLRLDRGYARPSYRPGCFVVHWLDRDIRETPESSGDFTKRSRFVAERDSLNAAVLGPDVTSDQREFDLFIREVVREMTVKSGQKCTAIRRILVPRAREQAVIGALTARLSEVKLGDPRVNDKVMGPFGQSRATGIRPRAGCRPSEL